MNNKLTAKTRAYLGLVKLLPCSVCGREGPSDAHHTKQSNQYTAVALCKDCHQNPMLGWHGSRRAWAIAKMDENDALNKTIENIMELINSK